MSNEPIDILAIQEEAERIAREEYMEAHKQLAERSKYISERENKWAQILKLLQMTPTVTPNGTVINEPDLNAVVAKIHQDVQEFYKLDKMFKLINSNILLKAQWDKLVMSIRLVGGDEA